MSEVRDIIDITNSNPGALQVMYELMKRHESQLSVILKLLNANGIRGSNIWSIYKLCNKNIDNFLKYILETYKSV